MRVIATNLCPDCPPVRAAREWAHDTLVSNLAYALLPFAIVLLVIVVVGGVLTRKETR
jgi:hypothetical protein